MLDLFNLPNNVGDKVMWIVLPGTFRHQHRYGWIDWRSQTINWINQKPSLISIFHDRLLKNCMTNFNSIATKCPMTRTIKIWKAHMPNMKINLTNSVSKIYFKSCDEFCTQKWWTWWIVPIQTEFNFDLTFDTISWSMVTYNFFWHVRFILLLVDILF